MIVVQSLDNRIGSVFSRIIEDYNPIENMKVTLDEENKSVKIIGSWENTKNEYSYGQFIYEYLANVDLRVEVLIPIQPFNYNRKLEIEKLKWIEVKKVRSKYKPDYDTNKLNGKYKRKTKVLY